MEKIIFWFLKRFFYLLYHPLAGLYDMVAGIVSIGKWNTWVRTVMPFIEGPNILELGHGPGHLQKYLLEQGYNIYGLDESMQMSRQAYRRLQPGLDPKLVRGRAENLPFANNTFHSIVATFPTQYITNPETLAEICRLLPADGQLIVLMSAWITGRSLPERLLAAVFRITGETPKLTDQPYQALLERFQQSGLFAELHWVEVPGSRLMLITAKKRE